MSARKRRPSAGLYSERLATSSLTRRYSGHEAEGGSKVVGTARPESRAVHGRHEPLVRVDDDRVGSLPAGEVVAQLRTDRRRAGIGRVDVEPDALARGCVGDRGHRIDRARGGGSRPSRRPRTPRSRSSASGRRRNSSSTGVVRGSSSSRRHAFSTDECACSEQTTTRAPGLAWRAAASAVIVAVEAVSSIWPCSPARQAEELREPVERHLLQLLESRRRAPEDPDLVQPGDQQLGEDPRLGGGADEVGEEARALPVGQAGQEDVVEIAEDVRERLRLLGRRGGQPRANLAWLDLREHGQLADALEVRGDPLERRRAVLAEAQGPTPNGKRRELAPAVGLELLEQRCCTDRTGDRKKRRYAGANLPERHRGPRVARERRVRHRLVDLSPVRRGVRVAPPRAPRISSFNVPSGSGAT